MAKSLKVLHIYSGNRFGGAENYLLTLARNKDLCPQMEHSFALCFEGLLSQSLSTYGADCHILGSARLSRPWTVWKVRRRLYRLMRASCPDLVFCHSYWPQVVLGPAVIKAGVPLAYRATDVPRGGQWLEKAASRVIPQLVVANSRHTENAILEHMYKNVPIKVIYNPVDNRNPNNARKVLSRIREDLDTEYDKIVFMVASRLVPLKGLHILLKALGTLSDRQDWQCWIAGGAQDANEDAYATQLRGIASKQGISDRVNFLGHRKDIPDLLCAADVYCQPNTEPDAFGIIFIEALYAGLPIVTSKLGGPVEIVNETCGRLLPPGDFKNLALVLEEILENPELRKSLSKGGPTQAQTISDPVRQMRHLYEAFLSICN